jgi:hypothetical protein
MVWGAGVIRNRWFQILLFGVIAAGYLGLARHAVLAQSSLSIDTRIAAPVSSKAATPKRRPQDPGLEEGAEEEAAPAPVPEASEEGAPDGGQALRTADGDAQTADAAGEVDAGAVLDGLVLADGTVPVLTGIAVLGVEPRTPEDIAAFELPPAGYDPYMFRIEPEPLRDRRPAELFLLEPYAPTGVRRPGYVIFPQAQIAGLATNNVQRSPARQGDAALEVRSDVRAVTDWRRHAMEFRAAGGAAFFAGHPSEDDRAYALEARGRLDISPRTNVEALISHELEKDTRAAPNAPLAAAERGDLEVDRAAVTFNHRFNRLAFQLRAAIRDFDFAPVPSLGGGSISNDARDLLARTAALRTTWDFGGGFGLFLETDLDDRNYHTPPADGISRSSTGEQYHAGVAFAPLSNTIRGEVSLGWGRQRPNVAALPELDGILIDANLAWRATPLTSFLFTAQSTFVDSITLASTGGLARQVGLEVRHAFARYLIGSAGVRYTTTPYTGISLRENELIGELGLDYYLGRDTILFGRYQHIAFDSTLPASQSDTDIVRMGVRLRY